MTETIDEALKKLGFENQEEFSRMVASVDISSMDSLAAFKKWQNEDGTKAGLLALQNKKR